MSTKDMCIVLLEPSHTREPRECPAKFVSMKHAKVSHAEGQLAIGAITMSKHETVARAIHRLEGELLFLYIEQEHILLVVLQVARLLPKLRVIHIGRYHLAEAALTVLALRWG